MSQKVKKLVAVLAISTSMTEKMERTKKLEWVSYIQYFVNFKDQTEALLDSGSKVNATSQAFTHQVGLKIWKTNVGAQKIDDTTLKTYEMVVFTFSVLDIDGRERFFEESFLLVDIKPDIVLKIPFLTMSNTDVDFQAWDLQWRSYTTGNVLSTTKQVDLIGKREFAVTTLDPEHKAYVVHVVAFNIDLGDEVHPSKRAIKVPSEYADFADVFSPKLATKLPEHIRINNHVIKLVDDQQPPYGLIL